MKGSFRLRTAGFVAAIFLFVSLSSYALMAAPRLLRIYDLEYGGKTYTAIIIYPYTTEYDAGFWGVSESISTEIRTMVQDLKSPVWSRRLAANHSGFQYYSDLSLQAQALTGEILESAQEWYLDYLGQRGLFKKDRDGSMRRALLELENFEHPSSSLVLITEKAPPPILLPSKSGSVPYLSYNLGEIFSMFRVIPLSSPHELAPMEVRVRGTPAAGHIDHLPPSLETLSELVWVREKYTPLLGSRIPLRFREVKNKWGYYGTAELKNFARKRHINLIEPAVKIAYAHGLLSKSAQTMPEEYVDQLVTRTAGGIKMWVGPEDEVVARIGQVYLECDGAFHRSFYAGKGFEVVRPFTNPHVPGSTTYWMKAPIDVFFERTLMSYTGEFLEDDDTFVTLIAGNTEEKLDCSYFLLAS